jgi:transposase-like protein
LPERKERQVGNKKVGRYPVEFRRMVVERMKQSNNLTALARELGVERKLMYVWREQLDPVTRAAKRVASTREEELERRVNQLERALANKTLELDFFKGALQKVEARRRQRRNSGGKTSTTTSGK